MIFIDPFEFAKNQLHLLPGISRFSPAEEKLEEPKFLRKITSEAQKYL